ncbi:TetR/AcrR family transcriptional regulator [Streptomyces sp. NBC_00257]|uniref:TetR/AcrR family transcriptional regulator n=1 Tax=unclassified Streptomyces TaxID=2593676 RepID=UPI002259E72D|nr:MULTISPECIES: TetR/AcrR family transcriptional regulator [unclassified Streptomyces]WTB58759.1 TetR/AcrR family transcriptional regulator [Streptomyces sp. NBC_00826]WTH88364.1 TetR/AcrR family transcriptional regulator [Streptomyces sp. NBC_00825]WTH97093.1 TetR/AcrR family transcriptional regulator [Streptomyces sp. NBC_00822]MCX4862584.1 TetR/AcrR family transcriptional regulator [Streptomyces sp. NBC_00906]MCX4893821.1 TetR/AcrR family transcriptional regulator [Streptomyces sp. NBC_008
MEPRTGKRADSGRPRPSLSPRLIVEACLALMDAEGADALTFRRVGAQLGADPAALSRHFRDKDDLLLAVADHLLGEGLEGFEPSDDWRQTLRGLLIRMHKVYLSHPRATVLATVRVTRRPAEMRAIELTLTALSDAGFPPEQAVRHYRALVDFLLARSCMDATHCTLDAHTRRGDDSAWSGEYAAVPAETHPHIAAAAPYLTSVDDDADFDFALDLMLDAIAARAPGKG